MNEQWDVEDLHRRVYELEQEQGQTQERIRKLEQQTEPMKVTRIELDPGGIQNRLDNHAEMMREMDQKLDLHTQAFVRIEQILSEHTQAISAVQADVKNIQATQSNQGKMLQEHGELLKRILEKLEGE